MDQTELQQKIAESYDKLPPKAQIAFSSMQWLEDLKKIIEKYNLNESQEQTLGTETMLVLLGVINLDEYEKFLEKELAVPKESFDKIIKEISDSILETIRPELIKAFEGTVEEVKVKEVKNVEEKVKNFKLSTEELQKRFGEQSEGLKQAIVRSDISSIVLELQKKHSLSIEQAGALETEIYKITLGIYPPEQFVDFLKLKMNILEDKAEEIAKEVNEMLLKRIREDLKIGSVDEDVDDTSLETMKEEDGIAGSESVEDSSVLKSAGIEMISEEKPKIDTGENYATKENREDMIQKMENPDLIVKEPIKIKTEEKPKIVPDISSMKFADTFKMPVEKTEYTLGNMSKDYQKSDKIISGPEIMSPEPRSDDRPKLPKTDPYRMPVE